MSLKQKTISGLYWTFVQRFAKQGIHFFVSIALARLLMPAEFGLVGMTSIFIAVGSVLIDSGLSSSLVRMHNPEQKDYSTVFIINVGGAIVIYLLMFFLAPFIADFFNQPALIMITRVQTLTFIIGSFSAVQFARLTRLMDFKTQLTIQIPSYVLGGLLGILLAWMGYGVWSLIWMNIFQSTLTTVQLWFRSGWTPDLKFDKNVFKRHFGFGHRLMLAGLLDTIYQNIYHVIIGRFFSPAQLGFYTRALSLRQLPVDNISYALRKVTMPMFASIQNDNKKIKFASRKLMMQVIFWIAPILLGLNVIAEPLFRLLFTEKWLPAVPYFRLLCVAGIMYPLHSYNLNILNVKGRSDLFLKLEIVKKILITIGVLIAVPFGIYGLLYAQIGITLIGVFINTWYSGKFIEYPVKEQLGDIIPIISLAVVCAGLTWFMDVVLVNLSWSDWARVSLAVPFYASIYLGISALTMFEPMRDFRELIVKR